MLVRITNQNVKYIQEYFRALCFKTLRNSLYAKHATVPTDQNSLLTSVAISSLYPLCAGTNAKVKAVETVI